MKHSWHGHIHSKFRLTGRLLDPIDPWKRLPYDLIFFHNTLDFLQNAKQRSVHIITYEQSHNNNDIYFSNPS